MLVSLQFKKTDSTHIAHSSIALPKATRPRSNENSISSALIERVFLFYCPMMHRLRGFLF
jgi:hypothetical protein